MRQAAANGDPNAAARGRRRDRAAEGGRAQLQQSQSARTGRDIEDALRQAEAMAREQQQIQEEVAKLDAAGRRARRARRSS